MLNDHMVSNGDGSTHEHDDVRDIHALTPPRRPWETSSHRSSNMSTAGRLTIEDHMALSREFGEMALTVNGSDESMLARIGEEMEEEEEETMNSLAIVPDTTTTPVEAVRSVGHLGGPSHAVEEVSMHRVKKEEIESKIMAWQTAEIAKVNNKFKRENAVIHGWECEEVERASAWMKKVERKLEEKRAKAQERMQNNLAKARRRAEEKRASAESKRGTKVARVLELANVMRALGKAPSKRAVF